VLDVIFIVATLTYFGLNVLCAVGFDRLMGGKR